MNACERTDCLLLDPALERHGGVREKRAAGAPSAFTLPARSPHVSCGECPLMEDAHDYEGAGKPRRNLMDTQVTKASQRVETCPSSQNLLNPLPLVIFTQQTVRRQHGRTSRATTTGLERRVVKSPSTSSRRIRF